MLDDILFRIQVGAKTFTFFTQNSNITHHEVIITQDHSIIKKYLTIMSLKAQHIYAACSDSIMKHNFYPKHLGILDIYKTLSNAASKDRYCPRTCKFEWRETYKMSVTALVYSTIEYCSSV